ncbi:hypothetical protein BC_1268 [Bacillus cereus ATCC 14579]|uniref:Uncharacterized protein n=1 Tax=Bacillus cereus (strain ATCC 14579 / DSM 31 / CCUG 7414 / JCM 2152 / NBRC 15305 / NCIMB 9373 / NCTC 2599 / NRRL B-3711) TaxID=226900 RepID=Q81GD8_BACCR|nr:hypothetical protein BC_1268 [Bacillus cereus ATCC 14579]EEL12448.1 hypothetical protein bcere0015_11390 [Bacillus cereus BDRD-Cer4]KZD86737.1 hypothetical protein B4155_1002 [Bacillus cereus]OOR43421.1 hypothetical protein BW896_24305 [Bacillus cereus]
MKTQVMDMVYDQIEDVFEEGTEKREQFNQAMEVWATSPKREIMEHFTTEEPRLKLWSIPLKSNES